MMQKKRVIEYDKELAQAKRLQPNLASREDMVAEAWRAAIDRDGVDLKLKETHVAAWVITMTRRWRNLCYNTMAALRKKLKWVAALGMNRV